MSELKSFIVMYDGKFIRAYEESEADKYIKELKDEIDSLKIKFREFNNNVCKKVCEASRAMSAISQDAQMDFYEEFINEAK